MVKTTGESRLDVNDDRIYSRLAPVGRPDSGGALARIALLGYAMAGLGVEVHRQAHRRFNGDVERWSRTDTGIVVVLVAFAALLSLSYAFASLPASTRSASASFATLYLAVAVWFALTRRRTTTATDHDTW